jgi:O-antigen/teichoic acid export membrane protein
MAMADRNREAQADPPGSPYQRFAKDAIAMGITTVLVALSGLLTLPLITKTLHVENYGIWAQALVTVSLFGGVAGLGLPAALLRFIPAKTDKTEIREDFYSVVCLTFAIILLLSATVAAAAAPIASVFFDGATDAVRLTALIFLVFTCTAVYLTLLRALRSVKTYALFVLLDAYGQVGLVAYLVLHDHGLLSLFYGVAALKSVILLCLIVYVGRRIGLGRPRFTNLTKYLRFGAPTIATGISWWVVQSADRYVIAGFLGATEVGIYSAGYSLGNVFFMVIGVISLVMLPACSKLYDEGRTAELNVHLSFSVKYVLLLGIPFTVGAAIMARPILTELSTTYIASRGYYVVPLVALSIVIYGVNVIFGLPLALAKKTHIPAMAWGIAAAVNLGLNVLLVPHFGIAAAAVTTLAGYALALVITVRYSVKEFTFPVDWLSIIKSLVASGIMAAVVWLLHPTTRSSTVITVVAGVAVYGLALLLLRAIRREEIAFFRGLLRRGQAVDVDQ